MVIDIKMCRFDNVPWGFRLVGGSDFEFPLTVVKVTEGSIAEEAGLRIGDVIVRVNDTATSPLTHEEANQIIRHCGNVFFLSVYREAEEQNDSSECKQGQDIRRTPDSFLDVASSCKSPISGTYSEDHDHMPDLADRPCSGLSENTEKKLVEAEIAAVLSNESEVLKEHNVIGIQPKPGVCMSSDVLRSINEEITKTKVERDKENRKWTTFLQKPNRPIPKSKAQIEAERHAANAYKVKIVKSAPKSPVREIVPPAVKEPSPVKEEPEFPPPIIEKPTSEEIKPENEKTVEETIRNEAPSPTDSELPSLEDVPEEKLQSIMASETTNTDNDPNDPNDDANANTELNTSSPIKSIEENQSTEETEYKEISAENNKSENISSIEESKPIAPAKTEEELALEHQLADVQRQLIALSSLPSTIQSTLDAVTKQLAELLPAFKLQQMHTINNEPLALQLDQIEEKNEEGDNVNEKSNELDNLETNKEIKSPIENGEVHTESEEVENEAPKVDVDVATETDEDVDASNTSAKNENKTSTEAPQMTEEESLKKQKKNDVIEELEEHLVRKRNPKRSKRAFGPLTPSSERPVVLPGGRRWYRPKDAYNDEFIAEILSCQTELITGTTLGVNFMKYQKPEKKIDLNRSEVYKVIHHLDRQPIRGIEIRAPIVAAEADIRRALQS